MQGYDYRFYFANKFYYESAIKNEFNLDFDQYVAKMKNLHSWGGFIEMNADSVLLETDIIVLRSNENLPDYSLSARFQVFFEFD